GDGPFHGAYRWAQAKWPHKPVMLAEWGASESHLDPGWKARMFGTAPRGLREMPRLKLISYFNSPGAKGDDKSVDTSAASMRAGSRGGTSKAASSPRSACTFASDPGVSCKRSSYRRTRTRLRCSMSSNSWRWAAVQLRS